MVCTKQEYNVFCKPSGFIRPMVLCAPWFCAAPLPQEQKQLPVATYKPSFSGTYEVGPIRKRQRAISSAVVDVSVPVCERPLDEQLPLKSQDPRQERLRHGSKDRAALLSYGMEELDGEHAVLVMTSRRLLFEFTAYNDVQGSFSVQAKLTGKNCLEHQHWSDTRLVLYLLMSILAPLCLSRPVFYVHASCLSTLYSTVLSVSLFMLWGCMQEDVLELPSAVLAFWEKAPMRPLSPAKSVLWYAVCPDVHIKESLLLIKVNTEPAFSWPSLFLNGEVSMTEALLPCLYGEGKGWH